MNTIRLYYENAYTRSFDAVVLDCRERPDGFALALNRTAFNPEGGGQAGDTGTLGGLRITDTHEADGVVWHYTDAPLSVGASVHGELDWAERFRKMQNHTGEHIVSGLVHSKYGFRNIGFHLGEDGCTIDFDGELTRAQLDELEDLANAAIWDNRPVTARFPDPDELRTLTYRAKLDLTENVRIVTVDGIDACACCAPHVSRTGEIGQIKLLDFMRHRGGVRIWLKSGSDALRDHRARYTATAAVSGLLNLPQTDIVRGTEKLLSQRDALKTELIGMKHRALEEQAASLSATDGHLVLFTDADDAGMRILANAGMEKCGGVCAVFSEQENGYQFVMGSLHRDMRIFAREIREPLNARGGGQEHMISGRCSTDRSTLKAFFASLS